MDCTFQAPLSMEFSRQEYWSGSPLPFPGDLPNTGIEPRSFALQADSLSFEPPEKPIVNRVAVKWCKNMSSGFAFNYFGYIHRNCIAGSYDNSTFNF